MKLFTYRALALTLMGLSSLQADNRMLLYLKHAPTAILDQVASEVRNEPSSQTPGAQADQLLHAKVPGLKPALSGIASLYGGYFCISGTDGLISFPLRHTTPKVYLAITPAIDLVRLRGNTFSHRAFLPAPNPTALYTMQQLTDDKKRSFWRVQQEQMPKDFVINNLTLVILADPQNFVVPEGDFLAAENPQLVLPDAVLVGRKDVDKCTLNAMSIRPYFEGISVEEKKSSDTCVESMIQNT